MEWLKKYLNGLVSEESQINDFLKKNDHRIGGFVRSLYEEQFVESLENSLISESEDERAIQSGESSSVNEPAEPYAIEKQQQADMAQIFSSGEGTNADILQNEALAYQIKDKQITFLNGKVNQPYVVDFDFEKLGSPEVSEVSFEGLDKIGLEYSSEEKKIKGIPTEAGDHKITMKFKIKGYDGRPLLEREAIIIINPDPRVLWSKNIPTPEDIEYFKPDNDKRFVKVETKYFRCKKRKMLRKDMVAASQRGRSHAIEGKPRDDDFDLHFDKETECYIMIVADGAGSAKYSRAGSQIACETAMNVCRGKLLTNKNAIIKNTKEENKNEIGQILQDTISSAVFGAYKAIEAEAQKTSSLTKDYATTLILSICKKFEYGWLVAAWWVGDGGIGIYDKDARKLKIMGVPDGGEFAGQTRFLTMPEIIKNELYDRMKFEVVEDFTALILMTDGVTDPKFETDANLNRIEQWDALWDDLSGNNEDGVKVDLSDDNEQSAEQLLKWLDFWSKGNHDDRTIAILY